jgi:hypothetical protein
VERGRAGGRRGSACAGMDEEEDYATFAALASLDKYAFENVSGDVRTSVSKKKDDDDDDDDEDHDDELTMPTTAVVGTIGQKSFHAFSLERLKLCSSRSC